MILQQEVELAQLQQEEEASRKLIAEVRRHGEETVASVAAAHARAVAPDQQADEGQ